MVERLTQLRWGQDIQPAEISGYNEVKLRYRAEPRPFEA